MSRYLCQFSLTLGARVQSFFSYSVVSVSPLVSEKSSGIQDNFHFERVDILEGPLEVCPEIYEPLALYVWTGHVHVVYNFKTG